jgi:hypothetical protein
MTLVLAALATSACLTFTPEQEKGAAEVRALADEAFRLYKVLRIPIIIGDHVQGTGGDYRGTSITLSTRALTSSTRDKIVAHELAHYILGHETFRLRGAPSSERQRQMELWELDANAKGVEILTRARPMPEELALSMFYDHMIGVHRAFLANRTVIPFGHRPPCEEIGDLLSRFPQHASWTARLECAKPEPVERPSVASLPPSREGNRSERFVWAYLATRSPADKAALEKAQDFPPRTVEFDRSLHRWVVLILALRPSAVSPVIEVAWRDETGKDRPMIATTLAGTAPDSTWRAHAVPMWMLRPYPGRWMARVSLDGEPVGEHEFRVLP